MLLDDPSPLVRRALSRCAGREPERAARDRARARGRSARNRRAGSGAVAVVRRRRSGRRRSDRIARGAGRRRRACRGAVRHRRRHRRGRRGRGLPGAGREFQRGDCAVLDRPHRRAPRPSCGDPRGAAGARGHSGADPSGACRQAVGDARRLRGRARLARRGPRPPGHARGVREGDRGACSRDARDGNSPLDPPFARHRPAQFRPDHARAAVRQHDFVRGGLGGACGHVDVARVGADPRSGQRCVSRAVRQGRTATVHISGVQGSDRGDARGRFRRRAGRRDAGSSAA